MPLLGGGREVLSMRHPAQHSAQRNKNRSRHAHNKKKGMKEEKEATSLRGGLCCLTLLLVAKEDSDALACWDPLGHAAQLPARDVKVASCGGHGLPLKLAVNPLE